MARASDSRLAKRTAEEGVTLPALHKAKEELDEALLIFEGLAHLYETNSNYRYIDQQPNLRGQGEAHVSLADVHSHIALLLPDDSEDQALHYRIAYENLDEADEIYKALPQTSKRNKRGLANSKKVRGNILRTQERNDECRNLWEEALEIYASNGDSMAEADMQKLLADLAMEIDKTAVFRRKVKEMKDGDNREEEAIKAAFDKFDADESGFIDMREYQNLASELGTFPALSEEELHEAMLQLDNSLDGKVNFEEFWMWWITDIVLDAEDPLKGKSRKKKRSKHVKPGAGGAGGATETA